MSGASPAWTSTDRPFTKILEGDSTGLFLPYDIAVDSRDRLYATNSNANSVTVYAADWASGDTAPVKSLSGPPEATGLTRPIGIAFDSTNRMYIANQFGGVNVYEANWADGATAPVKVLDLMGLGSPLYVAFDSRGMMYVTVLAPEGGSLVAAYDADWTTASPDLVAKVPPDKILRGPATGLGAQVRGIAFDAADRMYVVTTGLTLEEGKSVVTVYAPGWADGDTAPVKRLEGSETGLSQSIDVGIDFLGRMRVTNLNAQSVTIYDAEWPSGNTRPLTTLSGATSGLEQPIGMGFDAGGNMYVSSVGPPPTQTSRILMYSPDKSVEIAGTRPKASTLILTGKTSGIRIGSTVTAYLKVVTRGQKFKALPPVKVTGKGLAKGAFRVQVTNVNPKKAYQFYVIVDGIRSRTVTLAARP